ncbi:MAG: UvrB/UvrC motif-containing protein [Synergistetes bacterium]|nr:UvrB/UvrC motif-containing protein [Synergistota bacterium]MCX8127265.1 UvrB/UvrC motif-containing protein [Synergistota bacterium]MDW8191849.1 UvrB/UvrC motif-containing protein [Synergistota bacterium]
MKIMVCQNCKMKEATVNITRFIGGKKEELHFCKECAEKLLGGGDLLSFDFSLPDLLGTLLKPSSLPLWDESRHHTLKCPKCGLSYEGFQEIGKLGCSECYGTFKSKLVPLLRRIHGNTRHGGKIPLRANEELARLKELEKLREELNEAIKREEYEKAAEIRDKIREIEGKKV